MPEIRPSTFDQFIGQDRPKRVLEILCQAARKRGGTVPHLLLSGPPGLGKTTLARIVAHEMGGRLVETVASNLQYADQLASLLSGLQEGDVFFVDEVHGLSRAVEEILYSAMEDRRISVVQPGFDSLMKAIGLPGKTETARTIELPAFTMIGATTMAGLLSAPLRSRFTQTLTLEPYSVQDLQHIIMNAAHSLSFPVSLESAYEIARRSRATARIAIGHLRWLVEFCTAGDRQPDMAAIEEAFALREIDEAGLTKLDRDYLRVLVAADGPVGLATLAAVLGESTDTLAQSVEPWLVREAYVRRTPRGRVAGDKAHLVVSGRAIRMVS